MEALIAWAWPYLVAALAVVGGLWMVRSGGVEYGRNQERAKHAAQERENLDRIKRAADARPSGSVYDDPYNRDNG